MVEAVSGPTVSRLVEPARWILQEKPSDGAQPIEPKAVPRRQTLLSGARVPQPGGMRLRVSVLSCLFSTPEAS